MTYEVGHRKPPANNRFKKGQSGNPAGRPSASSLKNRQSEALVMELRELLCGKIYATRAGRRVRISRLKALVEMISQDAANGDTKAREQLLKLYEKLGLFAPEGQTAETVRVIVQGGLPDDGMRTRVESSGASDEFQKEVPLHWSNSR